VTSGYALKVNRLDNVNGINRVSTIALDYSAKVELDGSAFDDIPGARIDVNFDKTGGTVKDNWFICAS